MSQKHVAQVVLVGRPNVGKSTLFNRLTGARRSIVTPVAGTTRDVISHPMNWEGHAFDLTDTGGLFGASEDPLHDLVYARGRRALDEADLIVFVTDGREGLVPGDEDIAAAIRQTGKPAILAINKTDDRRARDGALDLARMGFDPLIEISAEHGLGVGDLLDAIIARVPAGSGAADPDADSAASTPPGEAERRRGDRTPDETAVAIVGRPNAGKSSLVNRLLREDRMIVSEVPGTTRDSVDSMLTWHQRKFRIVDTAGIRRPGSVSKSGQLESLSVLLARRAIERADVVVLVIDATVGPTEQDGAIAGAAHEAGRAIIILANKWDLMKTGDEDASKVFDQHVRDTLKFLDYATILHVSALTGERTSRLLETVEAVSKSSRTRVPTGELNRFFERVTTSSPPVTAGKRNMRVLYASQTGVAPPTFVLFTNATAKLHFSYERFLQNRLREAFGFAGTPIRIIVRGKAPRTHKGRTPERSDEPRRPARRSGGAQRRSR